MPHLKTQPHIACFGARATRVPSAASNAGVPTNLLLGGDINRHLLSII